MKKPSIGLILLSVLLCLSMLLISCNRNAAETQVEMTKAPETTEEPKTPTTENTPVNREADINKWKEYITFSSTETDTDVLNNVTNMFNEVDTDTKRVFVSDLGAFYKVSETDYEYNYFTDEYDTYYVSYKVYTKDGGKLVTSRSYYYDNDNYDNNPDYSFYAVADVLPILEVSVSEWMTKYDEDGNEYQEYDTLYSYYNEKGECLASNVEYEDCWEAEFCDLDSTYRLEVNGKIDVYTSYGEYITTFNKGEEKLIPEVTFEYGDYGYIDDGEYIYVIDKNYNKLSEYRISQDYDEYVYYILDNGNLLFVYESEVTMENVDYDYERTYGKKCIVKNVLFDVKSGKATEITRDFYICTLFSSDDASATGMDFKGEYQLAIITRPNEKGIAHVEYVPVILDNELNIVTELPTFVKAFFAVLGMVDENNLNILAYALSYYDDGNYNYVSETQTLYYNVNINDGTIKLVAGDNVMEEYIAGGFISDGKVYNNDSELIADLSGCDYHIDQYTFSSMMLSDGESVYLAYIQDGKFVKKLLGNEGCSIDKHENIIIVEDIIYYSYDDSTTGGDETLGDDWNNDDSYVIYKVYNIKGDLISEFSYNTYVETVGDGYAWFVCYNGYSFEYSYYIMK